MSCCSKQLLPCRTNFVGLVALHFQLLRAKSANWPGTISTNVDCLLLRQKWVSAGIFCFCAYLFVDKAQTSVQAHCGIQATISLLFFYCSCFDEHCISSIPLLVPGSGNEHTRHAFSKCRPSESFLLLVHPIGQGLQIEDSSKMAPKRLQDGLPAVQAGPKTAQDSSKWSQDGSKWSQDGLHVVQDSPSWLQDSLPAVQDGPKMAQTGSKMAQNGPKMALPLLFILSSYFVGLQALHFQQLQAKIVNTVSSLLES